MYSSLKLLQKLRISNTTLFDFFNKKNTEEAYLRHYNCNIYYFVNTKKVNCLKSVIPQKEKNVDICFILSQPDILALMFWLQLVSGARSAPHQSSGSPARASIHPHFPSTTEGI